MTSDAGEDSVLVLLARHEDSSHMMVYAQFSALSDWIDACDVMHFLSLAPRTDWLYTVHCTVYIL